MDDNNNLPVPKIDIKFTGNFNELVNQLVGAFYIIPGFENYLIDRFYHKDMCEHQKEQDKIAMNNGLAKYDPIKKQIVYFRDIDDPKLKIEARKEADREQQQAKLFDCFTEELRNKNLSLEDLVIGKDTDTNYFNEEFFHYWDKYSDDMRRADLQNLWAKILVQEMQNPHTISIRTMEFVKTLSTRDANVFNMILPYVMCNNTTPHIYNVINTIDIQYLEHLGLLIGSRVFTLGKGDTLFGKQIIKSDKFQFSSYSLSDIGKELYLIADVGDCDFGKLEEAFDNDERVEIGDKISFHRLVSETRHNLTSFRVYQKKQHKTDIKQKYINLLNLSEAPNI